MSKPAFPRPSKLTGDPHEDDMTLLEYYAGQALAGLCANPIYHEGNDWSRIPEYAFYQAKAMIKEVEKETSNQ